MIPFHHSYHSIPEFSKAVNGWLWNPDSNRNGLIWYGKEAARSVGIFTTFGEHIRVHVFDDRVSGFDNKITPFRRKVREDEELEDALRWAVKKAQSWMGTHSPTEWKHPDIIEAALTPPPGYVLDRYYLENREHIVYYRDPDAKRGTSINLRKPDPDLEATLDTYPYLNIRSWKGSGNATIALAPWLRAHEHELHEIIDPPEECGLEIAHKLLREYVEEETGLTADITVGQSDLGTWTA